MRGSHPPRGTRVRAVPAPPPAIERTYDLGELFSLGFTPRLKASDLHLAPSGGRTNILLDGGARLGQATYSVGAQECWTLSRATLRVLTRASLDRWLKAAASRPANGSEWLIAVPNSPAGLVAATRGSVAADEDSVECLTVLTRAIQILEQAGVRPDPFAITDEINHMEPPEMLKNRSAQPGWLAAAKAVVAEYKRKLELAGIARAAGWDWRD